MQIDWHCVVQSKQDNVLVEGCEWGTAAGRCGKRWRNFFRQILKSTKSEICCIYAEKTMPCDNNKIYNSIFTKSFGCAFTVNNLNKCTPYIVGCISMVSIPTNIFIFSSFSDLICYYLAVFRNKVLHMKYADLHNSKYALT